MDFDTWPEARRGRKEMWDVKIRAWNNHVPGVLWVPGVKTWMKIEQERAFAKNVKGSKGDRYLACIRTCVQIPRTHLKSKAWCCMLIIMALREVRQENPWGLLDTQPSQINEL